MKTKRHPFARVVMQLSAMVLGSGCILEIIGGPAPTSQIIVITATGETQPAGQPSASPTTGVIETLAPTPTFTPTLTATPTITATPTTAPVTMTAGQALSCVKGPHWVLFEWVTGIAKGETVTLLARSTADWPDYFYVRKSDGKECWAFGGSSTISGNIYSLPEREAPPLPEITLTIENRTYLIVDSVYIRGKDETVWGVDRLTGPNLVHGGTFSLTLTAGFYDVRMRDSSGRVLFEKQDTPIGPESSSRNIVYESKYPIVIRNAAADPLCQVVLNGEPGSSIEVEIPGDGIIAIGEEVTVEVLGGSYSFFIYRCGDALLYRSGVVYIGPGASPLVIS